MQSNVNGIMDDLNEFPDSWVEIYNEDSVAFDFTDYALGLSRRFEDAYSFIEPVAIEPNGYFLAYCDKEHDGRHTDFRLDVDGCMLYLFNPNGEVVDSVNIPKMKDVDISYGRVPNEQIQFSYFREATPGTKNSGFYTTDILKKPSFSVKGGIFKEPVVLKLSLQGICPDDAVIRYTMDGSEPTEESAIAPDSIVIEESKVIRAKTFSATALSKASKTESYLIIDRDIDLPIFSVSIDSSLMWDKNNGIYLSPDDENYWLYYDRKRRRPANIEYFVNGKSVVNQLGELNIGGNATRAFDLKSLVLRANKRFGEKNFKYKFWNSKPIEKTKTLYVRNAGQDNFSMYMRDALIQTAVGPHVDIDWAAYEPCVLYINGEYYGLMNLRERTNEDNVWENYDGLENIDFISQTLGYLNDVQCGDEKEWSVVDSLFKSESSTLSQFDSLINVSEFLDFFLVNSLFANTDFPGNNTAFWRERVNGGKWRWVLKDVDWGLGLNKLYDFRYLNYLTRTEPFDDLSEPANGNPEEAVFRYRKILSFPETRNMFIDKNVVYMGTFLNPMNFNRLTDSLASNVEDEVNFMQTWSRCPIQGNWMGSVKAVEGWYQSRSSFYYQHLADFFSLGDTTNLNISIASNSNQFYFNGIKFENNLLEGVYYCERPMYLSRNKNAFAYKGDSIWIDSVDSAFVSGNMTWRVEYKLADDTIRNSYKKDALYLVIPKGANNVVISANYIPELDTSVVDTLPQDTIVIDPIIPDTTQEELLDVVSLKAYGRNINVYPNPATDYVVVSGVENGDYVILTSMTGTVLVQCKAESSVVKVDLSELPNGYYLLLNKYRSYKIRKER